MTDKYHIYNTIEGWRKLPELISQYEHSGIFILVDENTAGLCLPLLIENCTCIRNAVVIEIQSGEENKTLAGAETIWRKLMTHRAMRNSLLICLGGGIITDLGGFVAATYHRGMDFIHIPTTLLAMVDAAIGGKNGLNLDSVKNQIGVFSLPKAVFIFTEFLETLPQKQFLSGYAEMLKHAMIDSRDHFDKMMEVSSFGIGEQNFIMESIAVKQNIVDKDFVEKGLRKALNFGHTIGHAIETYSHKNDPCPLLHGEAVAIGLICESYISVEMVGLPKDDLAKICKIVHHHFPFYHFKAGFADELLAIMEHDKKNRDSSSINFTLLHKIGEPVFDQYPGEKLVRESLHFYANIKT